MTRTTDSSTPLTLLHELWEDQASFNLLFRQPPANDAELAKQVKDFILYTESELHELLRTIQWKGHRNLQVQLNRPHMREECADILKCAISLFQICGLTPEDLVQAYWDKTAVVRQRYSEEWTKQINAPCAIIDIDNVICDYITGLCNWLMVRCEWDERLDVDRIVEVRDARGYVNADSMGVPDEYWKALKHEFRISSRKRELPVLPNSTIGLERLQLEGLQIVLLTSRPIDRYPNIYTDTLLWLQRHAIPFDFILWGHDKAERLLETDLRRHVKVTFDDDLMYAQQYAVLGLQSYHIDARQEEDVVLASKIHPTMFASSSLDVAVNHFLQFNKE
jgi:hypothetical protein